MRGFTLIEVLVVLTIVGILAGLAVGGLRPDPGREVVAEAWRLARLIERLEREADLTGEVLALRWQTDGYAFHRRDEEGGWSALPDGGTFTRRHLPASVRMAAAGEAVFVPDADHPVLDLRLVAASAQATVHVTPLGEALVRQGDGR